MVPARPCPQMSSGDSPSFLGSGAPSPCQFPASICLWEAGICQVVRGWCVYRLRVLVMASAPVTVQHLFPLSLLPPGWRTRGCLCAGTPRQPGPRGPSCPLPCTPEMTVCTLRAARLLYTLTSTHPHLYTHSPPRPEPGSWGSQIRNFGADFPLENVINNLHTVCLMSLQTNE